MKKFFIEAVVITVLWFGHFGLHKMCDTAGFWYDATIMVLAAKGLVWEYKDCRRIAKGEH